MILKTTGSTKLTRSSTLTGPGGASGPNSSKATGSNATNKPRGSHLLHSAYQFFRTEDFCSASALQSSPDPTANNQQNLNADSITPTDLMKHHLQKDDPEPSPNQKKLGKE
ncbi:hypothetical protein DSO57_1025149 [Entomophthora muscae]|uniref:Uncharacterized protein n=1 Tax=Entomophthora muscae TaxID=34485 RepID=A0ACC2TP76_9FUNG|nr:hypothetical protein DSO57_1025149 [Entomophthora muscae]